MKHIVRVITVLLSLFVTAAGLAQPYAQKDFSREVDSVLNLMTLEEKIGQLNQLSSNERFTGPVIQNTNQLEQVREGKVGSFLNITRPDILVQYQEAAMQSRMGIPLLFALDVIHGMKTIFPIPLGEAASFDLALMESSAQIAALEASAHGLHWTFAPMIDVSRDARWGRVMEGAGEDTWYNSQVAVVRVKGFQGEDYTDAKTVMACAKHFVAYSAAIAGKDYNTVDISRNSLWEVYFPPFKAALDAGVATFMNSFNDLDGMPATGNKYLQTDILKGIWNYQGFIVSDWNSIAEMIQHRVAENPKVAAKLAITAGNDMDMVSLAYITHLKDLVEEGIVSEGRIDDSVRRILLKKFELGLFEDPYRYFSRTKELEDESIIANYRSVARDAGRKSIVLLKNENKVLPILDTKKSTSIALVGPLMKSQRDMLGAWAGRGETKDVVTVYEGIEHALPNTKITYIEGYNLENNELIALPDLSKFDVIIVAVGERHNESGEARSKVDINIKASQQELVKRLKSSGKPVVALVMGGRPVVFSEMEPFADAILMTWWLGTEAGNAIADVLTGKYNPSAKLPMSFPGHLGQVPVYYNCKSTGRPWNPERRYTFGYIDHTILPAYPFGYGLSYTDFEIAAPVLDKGRYAMGETITIATSVENKGQVKGKETVQLYIQDVVSSLTRPIIEFRGFEQVELNPGEKRTVRFVLTDKDLGFYNVETQFVTEPGEFKVFVGNSSQNLQEISFVLSE